MTEPMPACCTAQHLTFLDDLRDSGVTNMFGATPYLQRVFKLSQADAMIVLAYWMRTFADRHRKEVPR